MGGILESIFGQWGALIVQFLVTLIVVVGLIGIVYWMVRRYSAGGLGRIGRGRVPRLALVDAMAVDGRRRLVLVRRDNVEHLIMIGGPADLVVEQNIQRQRRPKTAPSPDAEAVPATESVASQPAPAPIPQQSGPATIALPEQIARPRRVESAPAPEPTTPPPPYATNGATNGVGHNGPSANRGTHGGERTFSFRRPAPPPSSVSAPQSVPAPARIMDFQSPTRIDTPLAAPRDEAVQTALPSYFSAETEVELALPPEDRLPAFLTQNSAEEPDHSRSEYREPPPRGSAAMNPFARPAPAPAPTHDAETVAKVNDLEREMARLLGEITAKPN